MKPLAVESRFERRLLAGFVAGASVLLILAALTWNFSLKAVEATRFVVHTHEVIASLQRLRGNLSRAESEQRGYLISGNIEYLRRARQAMREIHVELNRLNVQLTDNPGQIDRLRLLRASCMRRIELLERNIELDDADPGISRKVSLVDGTEADQQIDAQLTAMHAEEQRLLKQRQQTESDRAYASALGFGALLLLMLIALPVLYRRLRDSERASLAAEAETARLVAVIDSTPDLIATATPAGHVFYFNRAAREALKLGDRPAHTITREMIYPRWAADIVNQIGIPAAIANGSWVGETALMSLDGQEIPVSQVLIAHRQPDGSVTLSTIARDISERKAADALLEEKNRQIATASRMKTEFLATMSHELRTPLNAIIGFSGVIGDGFAGQVSEQAKEYARDIQSSGRHLLALINDILDLSTIESGNMKLETGVVDGDELMTSAMAIVREQATTRAVRLMSRQSKDLGPLWLDPRKTRQIIINLLSNAVKFSEDGGEVRLSVQLVPRSAVGVSASGRSQRLLPLPDSDFKEFFEITVSDGGPGISAIDMHRLFQPFTQLDASRIRQHEGTGLGLVMVRRLTELQQGALLVDSAPQAGATFTVWLPLRDPAHAPKSDPENHRDDASPAPRPQMMPKSI